MVDEITNPESPESNDSKVDSETTKPLTVDEVKEIIDEKLEMFLQRIEELQNQRNNSFKKLIEDNSTKLNVEKLVREFLNYGEIDNLIDYTFIKSRRTKRQLEVDNIQMEKHRLGLIEGRPNFFEFCKYAHCQFEEMLNFYFFIRFGNDVAKFNQLVNSMRSRNSFIQAGNYSEIGMCVYSQKSAIFNEEKGINIFGITEGNRYASIRSKVSKLRNEYSHRNSEIAKAENEILKSFNSFKTEYETVKEIIKNYRMDKAYPNSKKNDELVSELLSANTITSEQKNIYDRVREIEQEYYQIKFVREEDWNEVRNSIRNLTSILKRELSTIP